MKTNEEIYRVIFNKIQREGRFLCESYELNADSFFGIPESITLNSKSNKITVTFEDGKKHVFSYESDVEIFLRPKEKEKTDEKISVNSTD